VRPRLARERGLAFFPSQMGADHMSQSGIERFWQARPVPKKPINENDATAKTVEDRELSDAELEGVAGGAGEDFGRSRG
jgi:hypothetical protein